MGNDMSIEKVYYTFLQKIDSNISKMTIESQFNTFLTIFNMWKSNEEKMKENEIRMNQTIKEKRDKLENRYVSEIKPLHKKAMQTCHDWTNTSCQDAAQILPMLQKYAKLAVIRKNSGEKNIPKKDKAGYDALENYRSTYIKFWRDVVKDNCLSVMVYPGRFEMIVFSTFHWAIYMTNNKSGEKKCEEGGEPETYSHIINQLDTNTSYKSKKQCENDIDKVQAYRVIIAKNFETMQDSAIEKEKKRTWWEYICKK
jgi:hypothetical protein